VTRSSLHLQFSIGIAECATLLQLLTQVNIGDVLERVGRKYKNVGNPKKIIPPDALMQAIIRLAEISAPFIAAMPGGPPPQGCSTLSSEGHRKH
jgi:hypothetical protein